MHASCDAISTPTLSLIWILLVSSFINPLRIRSSVFRAQSGRSSPAIPPAAAQRSHPSPLRTRPFGVPRRHCSEAARPRLHGGCPNLAAQILDTTPERTLGAPEKPLAHVLYSHQHVVTHLRHSSARSESASPAGTPATPALATEQNRPLPAPTPPSVVSVGR
jgi:hypothetical protein